MIQRSSSTAGGATFRVERVPDGGAEGVVSLRVAGDLSLAETDRLRAELERHAGEGAREVRVDLSELGRVDGASLAVLLDARAERRGAGVPFELVGARGEVAELLELYGCPSDHECLKPAPASIGTLDLVGRSTAEAARSGTRILGFVGDLVVSMVRAVRRPHTVGWSDVGRLAERAGADGLPIVLLINFLVGLIIALQSALQLQRFGAQVFVSNLVGLSMTRELAPLMTAIIVAGRSGAAFAAELGTMRVTEEIDALRVLRLDPLRQLVFPRVLALVLVVPALTLLGDLVGCLGGLVIALWTLDLSLETYLNGLQDAVGGSDVATGLIKSAVFAGTIALVACQRGLATRGGATGVGSSTTSAVVTTLFALVLIDALFTGVFNALGV